jgi:fatty-acid desaturase
LRVLIADWKFFILNHALNAASFSTFSRSVTKRIAIDRCKHHHRRKQVKQDPVNQTSTSKQLPLALVQQDILKSNQSQSKLWTNQTNNKKKPNKKFNPQLIALTSTLTSPQP